MGWMKTVVLVLSLSLSMLPGTLLGAKSKILYIASYHVDKGEWTAGIKAGIDSVLDQRSDVILKTHNMDTRLTRTDEKKISAALAAKEVIESFQPDVVIISDDNAAKFLLQPYYKNAKIPFVFCGLNWDAGVYNLPYKNTTGMVEVQLIGEIVEQLGHYAGGKRIGVLRGDTLSNRKEQAYFESHTGLEMTVRYVNNIMEWKESYLQLQDEVDMLVLGSLRALDTGSTSMDDIARFVLGATRIPSAAYDEFMHPVTLITLSTIPQEQGQWAAQQAIRILGGTDPATIPIVRNKKAKRILNMKIARKLGITFSLDILESSHLAGGRSKDRLHHSRPGVYSYAHEKMDVLAVGVLQTMEYPL